MPSTRRGGEGEGYLRTRRSAGMFVSAWKGTARRHMQSRAKICRRTREENGERGNGELTKKRKA